MSDGVGPGARARAGLENRRTGDALQFSFSPRLSSPGLLPVRYRKQSRRAQRRRCNLP